MTYLSPGIDKALPSTPVDIDDGEQLHVSLSKIVASPGPNKALPSVNVERTLSEQEMIRLYDLWNEAALSARHRRLRRTQNPNPRRIPAPISIPEPDVTLPTLSSVVTSVADTTPSPTRARKRWGFLTARSPPERNEADRKTSNALDALRAIARDRLRKKLRYAKSTPNLADQGAPSERVTLRQQVSTAVEMTSKEASASNIPTVLSTEELATPESIRSGGMDMDRNAIYFTMDPTWRTSQGSMRFQSITPIPTSPTGLGRPDSPLLHRHFSLDQLSFAAKEATEALTTMEFPAACPSSHPVDELHTYLEP